MEDDFEIIMSPLCQTYEKDGISLRVDIYRSEDSDWTLEIVNPSDTSIVWDDLFLSDQAAFDEFQRTVLEEGMRSFLDESGAA
jgi:hypothetical protein